MTETETATEDVTDKLKGAVPFDLQQLHAAHFSVLGTSNEITVILQRSRPLKTPAGQAADVAMVEPFAQLNMSPQSAKDLAIVLMDSIAKYEKTYGTLETEYTRSLKK